MRHHDRFTSLPRTIDRGLSGSATLRAASSSVVRAFSALGAAEVDGRSSAVREPRAPVPGVDEGANVNAPSSLNLAGAGTHTRPAHDLTTAAFLASQLGAKCAFSIGYVRPVSFRVDEG